MKIILSLCMMLLTISGLKAQDQLPTAFELGTVDEKVYEKFIQAYNQSLLEVAGFDMKKAFDSWVELMKSVDVYAAKVDYDLKGIQAFLQVFWSPDGSIDHIGYLLRPESRNFNEKEKEELTAFFSSFARNHSVPLKSSRGFNHYTEVTFPTEVERAN